MDTTTMSNPNWSSQKNAKVAKRGVSQVRNSYDGMACPGCKTPMPLNVPIYRNDEGSWVCRPCARGTAEPVSKPTTESVNMRAGWEHDTRHKPHSMSDPCTHCEEQPLLRRRSTIGR